MGLPREGVQGDFRAKGALCWLGEWESMLVSKIVSMCCFFDSLLFNRVTALYP